MRAIDVASAVEDLLATLSPGEPLPPERDLAARIGTSRVTLRRVVDDLAAAGRLVRRQGAGTFAAAPKLAQPLRVTSFSADMVARGMRPGARLVTARTEPAGAAVAQRLEVDPATEVLRVRRLRLADDEPMALEDLHVPADLVPGLVGEDLVDTSFYAVLAHRYGVEVASGEQLLEVTAASAEESTLLQVPLHAPAFLIERTTRDADGRRLELVRSVYRGDRYRIVAPLGTASPTVAPPATGRTSAPS
ncbi:GntR family transcriptional regulator [uncultured Pseudokineococcus sp.]|uniref:GntR family transcriptional regulator n=1 Tax=uncultured Pseudokineococcus sp. TaxID=1642928 RepID=UPI0026155B61|nr:GntR family transcriptional regulator [uncultured Pseudokineococcus sp.]